MQSPSRGRLTNFNSSIRVFCNFDTCLFSGEGRRTNPILRMRFLLFPSNSFSHLKSPTGDGIGANGLQMEDYQKLSYSSPPSIFQFTNGSISLIDLSKPSPTHVVFETLILEIMRMETWKHERNTRGSWVGLSLSWSPFTFSFRYLFHFVGQFLLWKYIDLHRYAYVLLFPTHIRKKYIVQAIVYTDPVTVCFHNNNF